MAYTKLIHKGIFDFFASDKGADVEYLIEYMEERHYTTHEYETKLRELYSLKYSTNRPDLIITVSYHALKFINEYGRELFPGVPVVFTGPVNYEVDELTIDNDLITGIYTEIGFGRQFTTIQRLQPGLERIVVITGSAPYDIFWRGKIAEVASAYKGDVEFEYLHDLSMDELKERISQYTKGTAVYYFMMYEDGAGYKYQPWKALTLFAPESGVPVFSSFDSYMGYGTVGGYQLSFELFGKLAAETAQRILEGEAPSNIPIVKHTDWPYIFDWRELKRWNINESDLPEGSIVRFRPPSVWEAYRVHLLIGAAVVVLQTVMIAVLLMQRARRRLTEEALRQSEERLALAADSAQAGLWSLDMNTDEFWITSETRGIFGFAPREDISFEQFVQVVHPDDRESVQNIVRQAVESGEGAQVEYRIVLRDGSVRWIYSRGRAHSKKSGTPACLLGVSIDVTERKVSEEAIREQKQFTEILINSLPGIFYLYDHEWKMVHWNRNHELLTGFSADELKGKMVLDWFSEEFKGAIADTVRRVFQEGDATVEAPLTFKDGSQIPYLFKGVRLEIAGELYFWGMGIDISQLKANEDALERSEQQLRLITDSLPALIAYIDSNQRYILVNESYANFVGLPRDQIPGKEIREVLGEDTFELIRKRVETVLSGQPVTFEITRPSSESELHHMLAMYVPDFREGAVHGFFASIHDVTDLEKAKKQARDARETLYNFGRVKMLDAISSSLSHEMQQPLTGVLSNAQAAEMLLENPQSDMDEISDIVKDIVADAKRAGKVMWQLHALLRKQDTNLQLLNLNGLIEDILSVLNSDMVIHNIKVVKDLAADLPQVMGDDVQLKQVLINLIVNAQQAMEDSVSGVDRLAIRTSVGGPGKITVGIEDSGPGIEEDMFEHIFEPFFTTRQEGTGMGLAISRFIIEAHGGQMRADNLAEGGARICFSLPVAEGSPES